MRWESIYDSYQQLPGGRRTTAQSAAHVGDFSSHLKGDKSVSYNQNCCQSLWKKYILRKIKQIFYIILKSTGFGVRKSQLSGMMLIERADVIDWG
jgi:hypothetical protein